MAGTGGELHRFNACLPAEIAGVVGAEAARYYADLKDELAALTAPSNGPIFDIPAIMIVTRKIKSGLKNLKYQMTDVERLFIVETLLKVALPEALVPVPAGIDTLDKRGVSVLQQAKILNSVTLVLTGQQDGSDKGKICIRSVKDASGVVSPGLRLSWRAVKAMIERDHLEKPSSSQGQASNLKGVHFQCGSGMAVTHRAYITAFARMARRYYEKSEAIEIWNECKQTLRFGNLQDMVIFKELGFLFLLFPSGADCSEFLHEWIEAWGWVDDCTAWNCLWLTLIYRATKSSPTFDWTPHLPIFFARLQKLLKLPNQKRYAPYCATNWPSRYEMFLYKSDDMRTNIKATKLIALLMSRASTAAAPVETYAVKLSLGKKDKTGRPPPPPFPLSSFAVCCHSLYSYFYLLLFRLILCLRIPNVCSFPLFSSNYDVKPPPQVRRLQFPKYANERSTCCLVRRRRFTLPTLANGWIDWAY
jgi:hypothetical protein